MQQEMVAWSQSLRSGLRSFFGHTHCRVEDDFRKLIVKGFAFCFSLAVIVNFLGR